MADEGKSRSGTSGAAKRLARLVAVQVLYQDSFDQEPLAEILRRSLEDADDILNGGEGEGELISDRPDPALLAAIVQGVKEHKETLSGMIEGALDARLSASRMEILLRSVLLAGAFELYRNPDAPVAVIVNDYVDVARAFFDAKEPGLVNAVLDRLAKKLRG